LGTVELWHSLTTNKNVIDNWIIVGQAVDLFGEAVKAFYAHAFLASCICTRASIEAVLHLAKTRDVVTQGRAKINFEDTEWRELKDWALRENLLDSELSDRIDSVRKHGNLGAHLAQQVDRSLLFHVSEPAQLWVSDQEAWDDLITCRDLILRIASKKTT
jgi:hypothetical protein